MMSIDIKDARTANLVKGAIDAKVVDLKSMLHDAVVADGDSTVGGLVGSMDMVTITELVIDINTLGEISDQISVKIQFPQEG